MKVVDLIVKYDKLTEEISDIERSLFRLCGKSTLTDKTSMLNDARKDERHSVKLLIKELDRNNEELELLKNMNITIQH